MPHDPRNIMRPQDYLHGRDHIFQSPESLRWFIRQNRAELVQAGALIAPSGRKMVVADAFDRVVYDVGARRFAESARPR